MSPNKGMFKVFSYTLAIAMLVSFLPGNMSDKPLDFSGFGEGIVQVVKSIGKMISDIDIHFDFGGDNKYAPAPPPSEKIVVQVDPDKDTEIKSPSEKITLKIPRGAVSKQAEIEFIEYTPTGSTGMVMLNRFELNAREKDTGTLFSKFSKSLEITIQHDPAELAGLDIASLRLYYLNEKTKQWVPVATDKYDSKTNSLKATVDHFSTYGEFANPTIVGPGRVMAAQVSLSSGTATFSYPFELPPGPGGFQPKLELTYNSGSVDEMKNKQAVGSWVGIGWSLDLGQIGYSEATRQYFLDLNGYSYKLVKIDSTHYQTNPEQYFKITRCENTWEVLDRDGNYYKFGGTTDSEQYIGEEFNEEQIKKYYRWDLTQIKDVNGNQATVTYVRDIRGTFPYDWVRSAYPEYLTYGNVQIHIICGWDQSTNDGYVRYDNPITSNNPAPKVMENRKLNSIEIKVSGNLVRKYNFAYSTTNRVYSGEYGGIYYAGKHSLTSITQIGADNSAQLPAISFAYEDKEIYRWTGEVDWEGTPINQTSFFWPHLTNVNSGYGSSISFSYTQIPGYTSANIWTREVVTAKTINSGIGTTENYTYEYSGGPQYLGTNWDQQFGGFTCVKETDAVGNYIKHWFYTTAGNTINRLAGREYKTQWYNSSSSLLREKNYDWGWSNTSLIKNCFLSSWSIPSMPVGSGIEVSNTGQIYLSVYSWGPSGAIYKYDVNGNYLGAIAGQFNMPRTLALKGNYVYVSD